MTFDKFIGPHMVSPAFDLDGRDEDSEVYWESADTALEPCWSEGGYSVRRLPDFEPPNTFILFAPDGEACGWYSDAMCWVDEAHRGRGLSTQLILAAANFLKGRPIRPDPGPIGFSEAGYAAFRVAHRSSVASALAEGLKVPERVRAEFEGQPSDDEPDSPCP
jgi:GNAT superfamily N-acetyltransferase